MKKIILALIIAISAYANSIKDDTFFAGVSAGAIDIYSTDTTLDAKLGYYFYSPNRFHINNRIYADFNYVNSDADFYITSLKLDWIKNNSKVSPFLGLSYGYMYFKQNGIDLSTSVWGVQGGILINMNEKFDVEISANWQNAIDKKDTWDRSIKSAAIGIIANF